METTEPKITRTLMRGLRILECFAQRESGPGLSLTDVASRSEMDKATALRLLTTYCVAGYLRRDDKTQLYSLTAKILRLSQGISQYQVVIETANGHLRALRDEVREVVHLGVVENKRVVYIDKLETDQSVQLVSAVGQDMPLNTTSLGKAILAYRLLDGGEDIAAYRDAFEARTDRSLMDEPSLRRELRRTVERRFSIDDNENQDGVVCVGAPIFDRSKLPAAAISVSGPDYRMRERIEQVGRRCRETADAISSTLKAL